MSSEAFSQPSETLWEPFNEFILKTANGCNMQPQHELDRDPMALIHPGCDHCYMYTHSTAWQQEPDLMEPLVVERVVQRIAEHAETHRLAHVRIIAHGGEPLLALQKYPQYYTNLARMVHEQVDPIGTQAHLYIQTNGLLITERRGPDIIKQLSEAGFSIGLSIDGPQLANDLHRRDKAGRSTHSRAERAAKLLRKAGADWSVLGVIDPRTNPEETVEYLANLEPQSINLFPLHAHNSAPPLQYPGALSLGEWQKRAFNRYNNWHLHHPETTGPPFAMPIYDNYLQIAFGARSINDTAGERTTQELYITPSGKLERLDTLKSTDDGAVFTGRNIFEHSIDDMRFDPGIIARRAGLAALAAECQGCEVLNLCFGGHYPNRYKAPDEPLNPQSSIEEFVAAFQNPSAHCDSHKVFLNYIGNVVRGVPKTLPQPIATSLAELNPEDFLSPQEATSSIDMHAALHQYWSSREKVANLSQTKHLIDSSSRYQGFPLPLKPREYYLAPGDIDPVFRAIQSRQLVGREALVAASMIAQNMHTGPVAYFGSDSREDRIPSDNEVVMLSKDHNDAIINSMITASNPVFRDVKDWGNQKSGGYRFITREIANVIMEHHEKISSYVIPAQLPIDVSRDTIFQGECGIDYWEPIFYRAITSPIPVTAYDLPGDLLIVEGPEDGSQSAAAFMTEIVSMMPAYKNPELLAQTLKESGKGTITPLWGTWPSSRVGAEWATQPHIPSSSTLPAVSDDITKIIDSQISDRDIPLYRDSPFYEDMLKERSASL